MDVSLPMELLTERLILRPWRDADLEPFARMNADPRVMEFFPSLLSCAESYAMVERAGRHWEDHGLGLFAAELRDTGEFAGFIGLMKPRFQAHFTPCVEIGWRLAREHWGSGLATEGARAVLEFAFDHCHLREVVSFTVPANVRSRRVMEKIGMIRDVDGDFDHPLLPRGHALSRHVLYRIAAPSAFR